jgi:thymidylate kinase
MRLGQTVVTCRWWQSVLAYGAESGLDEGWIRRTVHCLPRADVNVLLDLDPARARRRPGAPPDRLEADLARQEGVRRRYLDLWRRCDGEHGFWAVVCAEGGVDVVHGRILGVLEASRVFDPRVVFTDGSRGKAW